VNVNDSPDVTVSIGRTSTSSMPESPAAAGVATQQTIVGLFSLGVAAVTAHQRSRGAAAAWSLTLVAGYACISAAGLIAV